MRRQFAFLPVGVVSIVAAFGCGGATQASLGGDAGTSVGGGDAGTGATGDAGGATSEGGSMFDPGSIVGFLGGGSDAGMAMATMEGGTSGPDQSDAGPAMSLPPQQVTDGCSQLCTKEASASCPAQGSLNSCLVGCRLLASNP